MVRKMLVEKLKNKFVSKEIEILENPSKLSPLMSPLGFKVFKTISKKPMYASEIAEYLQEDEQKIYYHLNQMRKNNLICIDHEEEKRGALCKFYSPVSKSFGFEVGDSESHAISMDNQSNKLKKFFEDFVGSGVFNGVFVVGSPVQHGPYLTVARDGHLIVPLSILIGSISSIGEKFPVMLDVEMIAQKSYRENIVLVGGPVTNLVSSELNDKMKIRFSWKKKWVIENEGKIIDEPGCGLVANIRNPWDKSKRIILLAGLDFVGTKSCICAISYFGEKFLSNYNPDEEFYAIVKGKYNEENGKIENIKIIN